MKLNLLIGFVLGIVMTVITGWMLMPKFMMTELQSPYSVTETVEKISNNATAEGWVISSVQALHKSIKKHNDKDLLPVTLINLCQADHAYNILKTDENKIISVMMPCTISVYKKSNGKTYVATINTGLLGAMFGGTVAEIMGGAVAAQQHKFLGFLN